ncbi:unnamed protein product (macronuclear) [Paramecium tetraurelia]|uniref:Uncharacterized protein n=1 Tax=Paramecium tetraurelia TaxID=5888 RepID=A0CMP1_PARTE|nr:uncharacterized protein GSPATT00008537001 [Paramecium tetraurelia]CAK72058.1 unnamed protein product [Paramecium tetraurelia]|eukprot:XP_001439455.1 hypothetical protein (macronuclear) [Paramecium tetraurelia strain d4-2]
MSNRIRFEFKKGLETQSQKVQQLEEKINELQIDNQKKQQEIDNLIAGQKKLTNDLKKVWNNFSSTLKSQRSESQMISNLSVFQEQSTIYQDLSQQTKQIIQQEIQSRFLLIKDIVLKKSDFDEYSKKVEEQFETLRQKVQTFTQYSQPEFEFGPRRDSFQGKVPTFQFQQPPIKGNAQAMKQYLYFTKLQDSLKKRKKKMNKQQY